VVLKRILRLKRTGWRTGWIPEAERPVPTQNRGVPRRLGGRDGDTSFEGAHTFRCRREGFSLEVNISSMTGAHSFNFD